MVLKSIYDSELTEIRTPAGTIMPVTENIIFRRKNMANDRFLSIRFENLGSSEEEIYSVFVNRSEDGPQMVWYDAMGDPIAESVISDGEWNDVMRLAEECGIADWDGFEEMDGASEAGFSFEAEDADGSILFAQGTGSFPEGYETFEKGIRTIFAGYLE